MLVGTVTAIAHGTALPIAMWVFGLLTNVFVNFFSSQQLANTELSYVECTLYGGGGRGGEGRGGEGRGGEGRGGEGRGGEGRGGGLPDEISRVTVDMYVAKKLSARVLGSVCDISPNHSHRECLHVDFRELSFAKDSYIHVLLGICIPSSALLP